MARWSETPLSRNDLLWQAKREGAVVSHPCAKNAQGWGTLSRNGAYRNHYRWATRQILWYRQHRTRPCKERKDGAPTVSIQERRVWKTGPPVLGSTMLDAVDPAKLPPPPPADPCTGIKWVPGRNGTTVGVLACQ